MTTLFDKVPADIFLPLSRRGVLVYADVLLALFAASPRTNLLLPRELAVVTIDGVLKDDTDWMELTAEVPPDSQDSNLLLQVALDRAGASRNG